MPGGPHTLKGGSRKDTPRPKQPEKIDIAQENSGTVLNFNISHDTSLSGDTTIKAAGDTDPINSQNQG